MFVSGVYRAPPPARTGRSLRAGGGFQLPEARPEGAEGAEGAGAAASVAMPSLLLMQEAGSAALQDRDAKRHGTAVLDELQLLQRSLLGGEGPALDRLAQLARRPVPAADPKLAGVLRAIQLRAGIELSRRGAAASG
jgi:hypothetical protein